MAYVEAKLAETEIAELYTIKDIFLKFKDIVKSDVVKAAKIEKTKVSAWKQILFDDPQLAIRKRIELKPNIFSSIIYFGFSFFC